VHEINDKETVRRYVGGEQSAFNLLYKKYYPRLYGYCFRLVNDRDTVEDIIQAVFIKAMESIRTLEKPELFYYWLFTIARNEIYALFRREKQQATIGFSDDVIDEITPHDYFVRGETASLVEEGLNRLKPEYREVIILRQYEKLSYAEIAAITGDTISSVESRLFKARRALIRFLQPLLKEEGVS